MQHLLDQKEKNLHFVAVPGCTHSQPPDPHYSGMRPEACHHFAPTAADVATEHLPKVIAASAAPLNHLAVQHLDQEPIILL